MTRKYIRKKLTKKQRKNLIDDTRISQKSPSHLHLDLRIKREIKKKSGKVLYYDRYTGKKISKKKANHIYGVTKYWNKLRHYKRVKVKNVIHDGADFSTVPNYNLTELRKIDNEIKDMRRRMKNENNYRKLTKAQKEQLNREIKIEIGKTYFGS